MNTPRLRRPLAAWLALPLLALPVLAQADDHGRRVPPLPAYQQECGACHVAFPVGLLGATSWDRVMRNLPRHFGTDASLDAATTRQIGDWLAANASTRRGANPADDRITRTDWFVREHDEVPADAWKRAAIKSASNCAACHTRAAEGSFREREIRIPK